MLNRLRNRLEPFLNRSALSLASRGLSPNQLSLLSFFASIAAAIMYALSSHATSANSYFITLLAGIILLIGGLFDVLDGAVARLTNKSTKRGAFMDSLLDKVGEIVVFIAIYLGNLSSAFWCLIAISLALLVSLYESTCRVSRYTFNRDWNRRTCRKIAHPCPDRYDSSQRCNSSCRHYRVNCSRNNDYSKS